MLPALSRTVIVLLVGVGLMAACFNIAMPTVVGLLSKRSPESEQGNVMGTTSSAISAASLIGPVFANGIFSISMRGNYLDPSAFGIIAVFLSFTNVKNGLY